MLALDWLARGSLPSSLFPLDLSSSSHPYPSLSMAGVLGCAQSVNVYDVPLLNPLTVIAPPVELDRVPENPPGLDVAV